MCILSLSGQCPELIYDGELHRGRLQQILHRGLSDWTARIEVQ
uniref:Uncharacterized protein n=1 Tax=Arundo donax TaxID=35708 RepID=A0A0A9CR93_ARUDO